MGLPDANATARVLGIDPISVRRLRKGTHRPHPSTARLMYVLEKCPTALRRLLKERE